jgi:predicted DsbA family dithiol-disulfide isomerase
METLEVWADLWCPFANVGLRAAKQACAELGHPEVVLVVRAWPLELVNGEPMDPGRAAANAAALRAQVSPELFGGVDPERFPSTTLPALALVHAAGRVDPSLGELVGFALRDALFEEGLDLADPAVLAELGARFGLPPVDEQDVAGVLADYEEGRARGVIGSPHFFCDHADHFCPSLEITSTESGRSIRRQQAELRGFLERCLGRTGPGSRGEPGGLV